MANAELLLYNFLFIESIIGLVISTLFARKLIGLNLLNMRIGYDALQYETLASPEDLSAYKNQKQQTVFAELRQARTDLDYQPLTDENKLDLRKVIVSKVELSKALVLLGTLDRATADDVSPNFVYERFNQAFGHDSQGRAVAAFNNPQETVLVRTMLRSQFERSEMVAGPAEENGARPRHNPRLNFSENLQQKMSPSEQEVVTLNNQFPGREIIITPSSVIDSRFNARIISSREDRPKWFQMPSAVFSASTESVNAARNLEGFGDIQSFASNKGFTREFLEQSPFLSHAQKLFEFSSQQVIRNEIKEDQFGNKDREFQTSLHSLVSAVSAYFQRVVEDSIDADPVTINHNEYAAKLDLWNLEGVEIGNDPGNAIASLIELQIRRHSLNMEITEQGTAHPLLTALFERISSKDENGQLRTLEQTKAKADEMSVDDKQIIMNDIQARLAKGLGLYIYDTSEAEPIFRSVTAFDLTYDDVVKGLERSVATYAGSLDQLFPSAVES